MDLQKAKLREWKVIDYIITGETELCFSYDPKKDEFVVHRETEDTDKGTYFSNTLKDRERAVKFYLGLYSKEEEPYKLVTEEKLIAMSADLLDKIEKEEYLELDGEIIPKAPETAPAPA